jgi:hypothetical protein
LREFTVAGSRWRVIWEGGIFAGVAIVSWVVGCRVFGSGFEWVGLLICWILGL